MPVSTEVIESIREKFLNDYKANPNAYYESDVDRIKNEIWPVERHALVNKSEDSAVKSLIKAMKWRKEFGVLDRKDQDFPVEIYQTLSCVQYNKDKEGRPILYSVGRYYHKSELGLLIRQFIIHHIEQVDKSTTHQGWVLVHNSNGAGLSNVEMDFCYFLIGVLQDYYPRGAKHFLVVDMPWVLNATWKILKNFMNEELRNIIVFVNKDEIKTKYVDENNLPQEIGGTSQTPLVLIPQGCVTMEKLPQLGLNEKQISKLRSIFKDALKDNPACY